MRKMNKNGLKKLHEIVDRVALSSRSLEQSLAFCLDRFDLQTDIMAAESILDAIGPFIEAVDTLKGYFDSAKSSDDGVGEIIRSLLH